MDKEEKFITSQGAFPVYIGGQAVIEGVMMRGKTMYAMAVRDTEGKIVLEEKELKVKQSKFLKMPIVRGVVSFIDSLVLGMKIITRSAEMAGLEEGTEEPGKFEKFLMNTFGDKLNDIVMGISVILAVALAVGLFMMLPVFVGSLFSGFDIVSENGWAIGIIEGLARLLIFIGYIYLISLNKDVSRVYQYHGAEHKTINCFEHGEELTVSNVRKYSRFHRRCGTSFLLIVMLISMVFFLFVRTPDPATRIISRVLFVPFIAGVSYEVIRWAGRSKSKFVDIISYPGIKMQAMTTKEPDEAQIECAIKAMSAVAEAENQRPAGKRN